MVLEETVVDSRNDGTPVVKVVSTAIPLLLQFRRCRCELISCQHVYGYNLYAMPHWQSNVARQCWLFTSYLGWLDWLHVPLFSASGSLAMMLHCCVTAAATTFCCMFSLEFFLSVGKEVAWSMESSSGGNGKW